MDEGSGAGAGTGADDKARRKRTPPPKLSAMIPFALGCLAPVPIMMGALDKVPGEKAPRTPVLYEFNKLFKLCGAPVRVPAPAPARWTLAAGRGLTPRPAPLGRGPISGDAARDAHGDQASHGRSDAPARFRPVRARAARPGDGQTCALAECRVATENLRAPRAQHTPSMQCYCTHARPLLGSAATGPGVQH